MRGLQGEGQKQSITGELVLLGLVFQNPTYKLVYASVFHYLWIDLF